MDKVAPLAPIEPIVFSSVSELERRQTSLALQEAREASSKPRAKRSIWRRRKSKPLAEAS